MFAVTTGNGFTVTVVVAELLEQFVQGKLPLIQDILEPPTVTL